MNRLKSVDLIRAIELAYDRTSDETTWLAEITTTLAPAFGGMPLTSYVFDLSDQRGVSGRVALVRAYKESYRL